MKYLTNTSIYSYAFLLGAVFWVVLALGAAGSALAQGSVVDVAYAGLFVAVILAATSYYVRLGSRLDESGIELVNRAQAQSRLGVVRLGESAERERVNRKAA